MATRNLLAGMVVTASLFAGSAAMAQMTNDTIGGTNRSGMQSGQPMMQGGTMDDSRMTTGTTRTMSTKKMRTSKKMKRSRMMRMRQMGNDTMNSSSGMSKTSGGRGGNMGGSGM